MFSSNHRRKSTLSPFIYESYHCQPPEPTFVDIYPRIVCYVTTAARTKDEHRRGFTNVRFTYAYIRLKSQTRDRLVAMMS